MSGTGTEPGHGHPSQYKPGPTYVKFLDRDQDATAMTEQHIRLLTQLQLVKQEQQIELKQHKTDSHWCCKHALITESKTDIIILPNVMLYHNAELLIIIISISINRTIITVIITN